MRPLPTTTRGKRQYGEVVQQDVFVIGGGASGVHAAVSLKDKGKTVVAAEHLNRLGGNTLAYLNPATGILIDVGDVVFQPLPAVLRFFDKFKVPLVNTSTLTANVPGQPANLSVPAPLYQTIQTYTDLQDESGVTITRDDLAIGPALAVVTAIIATYAYILDGFQALPHPVP
jgi:uncharacterized protein with NAD-binding domain and iron-sulfur cluster